MVSLTTNQCTKVENNALGFITLSKNGGVRMLEGCKFLLVALTFVLKILSNFLLENEGLKGIITLLLGARETSSKARCFILLLIDESSEATVLAFVILNLDLEILSFFGELLSESLEFEKLSEVSEII